ncbi:integrase [Thioalkalivibrio sulfidiphilus]|uniref:integrase n=1 Tax=Thioalkalivibrio sulfidiphilus TaxID=1033854 RepID=UPI003B39D245
MASIIKRGRSVQVKIRKRGYPSITRTFDTVREARLWADSTELAMERGEWAPEDHDTAISAKRLPVSEALDRFYVEFIQTRRKNPRPEYLRIERLKRTELAGFSLTTLRKQHIAKYIRKRLKQVSPDTVRLEIALISRMYNYAISDWNFDTLVNPTKGINKPAPSAGRERRLAPGEVGAMIGALPLRHAMIACFAIETAMRRAEIARLRWEHIDLRNRVAYLRVTKNKTPRTVPLSLGAMAVLEMLEGRSGSVFQVQPDSISQGWGRARKAAKISGLTFHDLRHEAVSRLFETTDLDMMEIKVISGHKSMSMLARYTHLRAADLVGRLDGEQRGKRMAPGEDPASAGSVQSEARPGSTSSVATRYRDNVVAFRRRGTE